MHPPPSQVVSQPPVPVQATVEPMPTCNAHSVVPVHDAVQSTPHAAVQPAVPVHATVQWSAHVEVHASVPVQVQAPGTQMHPNPPAEQCGAPPGFGAPALHAASTTTATEMSENRIALATPRGLEPLLLA